MSGNRLSVIGRLQHEMKESPLPAPETQPPERRVLIDSYERQTPEEPLQITEKYRHRVRRMILHGIIILIIAAFLVIAVVKAGIISI